MTLFEQLREALRLAEVLADERDAHAGHRVVQILGDTVAVGGLPATGLPRLGVARVHHQQQARAEGEGRGVGGLHDVGGRVAVSVEEGEVEVAAGLVVDALAQSRHAAPHLGLIVAADEVGGFELGRLAHGSEGWLMAC